MGGKHKIFMFNNVNYDEVLIILELIELIEEYIEDYNFCKIDIIQLIIINVDKLPELETGRNINLLRLNKEIIKIGEVKRNFNSLKLPFTMEKVYYGKIIFMIEKLNKIEVFRKGHFIKRINW